MKILHTENKDRFIAYNKLNSSRKKAPFIIFHHGLMSDMNGSKALYVEKHCKERDYNFIRFDNFGHGKSSGEFTDQTIATWLEGLSLIIDNLVDSPMLLVGSSMGAWITMLQSLKSPKEVIGLIGVSSAPDFTEELIWDKITTDQKESLIENGLIEVTGSSPDCSHAYPVNYDLITDGRKHLLLNKEQIDISCPTHLIHGMQDLDVPYNISERISSKIMTDKVVLKLIKGANHSLSREEDCRIICNSIEEVLSLA